MTYRHTQDESRAHYLSSYDAEEASRYDAWISSLTEADHEACLRDLEEKVTFAHDASILDAGSGTGALCMVLVRLANVRISALEPCQAMTDLLRAKSQLDAVRVTQGFCDHVDDRKHFGEGAFSSIVSQLLTNCLYDPIAAFQNWYYWLETDGRVVVMDGLFDRDGWSGSWKAIVDCLPLSACRTMATIPYLLEHVGFEIESCGPMAHTNAQPSTRTERFMVVAKKPAIGSATSETCDVDNE